MIQPLMSNERARLWHEHAKLVREISCVKQRIKAIAKDLGLTVKEATIWAKYEEKEEM